ncbi:MAG: VOC family protein [Immundisolibacteraceae bacterium]|nr:VOC family protein [Immundisolibacteraceae bacterium]
MSVEAVEHCAIRTTKLELSRVFYGDLLGLEVGPRPELPVPGYWLYAGEQAVIHLIEVGDGYRHDPHGVLLDSEQVTGYRNGLDHIAFRVKGLAELRDRLKAAGVKYGENRIEAFGMHQLFVEDPNGVTAELNFLIADEES